MFGLLGIVQGALPESLFCKVNAVCKGHPSL